MGRERYKAAKQTRVLMFYFVNILDFICTGIHMVCCFDSYKIILCSVEYFKMSWGISLREKIKIKWVVKRYRWPERQKQYKDDSNVEL